MTKNGRRESSFTAYLEPNLNKPNLFVVTQAMVTKILINGSKQAYGVEYVLKSNPTRKIEVRARKEVILCQGPIRTPQLLMLSGIGPAPHLKEKNIPVIVSLPVGYNLAAQFRPLGIHATINSNVKSPQNSEQISGLKDLFVNNGGPLSHLDQTNIMISSSLNLGLNNLDYPDIMVSVVPTSPSNDNLSKINTSF
jgi:choline dehydrogenase-like flavoprotein